MQNGVTDIIQPLVAVWMVTYNHESYIQQSVESIMAQKTSFDYVLIIGEDNSTDNTRKLCLMLKDKYPGKIELLLNKKNLGGIKNAVNVYEACFKSGAKYIAMCEGDDYWNDLHKLQKQVDFLESNSGYSICWTKYQILNETRDYANKELADPDWLPVIENKERFNVDVDNIFNPYATYTLTVMFRREAINVKLLGGMRYLRDNTIYCMCLGYGRGVVLNFFSGVYRKHGTGFFSGATAYKQRYSNFLNLNEIIRTIPNCRSANLKAIRTGYLMEAFHLCMLNKQFSDLPKLLKLYYYILLHCKFDDKLKASENLIKQVILLARQKNKTAIELTKSGFDA